MLLFKYLLDRDKTRSIYLKYYLQGTVSILGSNCTRL